MRKTHQFFLACALFLAATVQAAPASAAAEQPQCGERWVVIELTRMIAANNRLVDGIKFQLSQIQPEGAAGAGALRCSLYLQLLDPGTGRVDDALDIDYQLHPIAGGNYSLSYQPHRP